MSQKMAAVSINDVETTFRKNLSKEIKFAGLIRTLIGTFIGLIVMLIIFYIK